MAFSDELLMKTEWAGQSSSKWVFSLALFLCLVRKFSISILILNWMPTYPLWSQRGKSRVIVPITSLLVLSLSLDLIFLFDSVQTGGNDTNLLG